MDTGILIALAFAAGIVVIALLLGRMLARSKPRRRDKHDINASGRDGRATASWIGIREAGRSDTGDHQG